MSGSGFSGPMKMDKLHFLVESLGFYFSHTHTKTVCTAERVTKTTCCRVPGCRQGSCGYQSSHVLIAGPLTCRSTWNIIRSVTRFTAMYTCSARFRGRNGLRRAMLFFHIFACTKSCRKSCSFLTFRTVFRCVTDTSRSGSCSLQGLISLNLSRPPRSPLLPVTHNQSPQCGSPRSPLR